MCQDGEMEFALPVIDHQVGNRCGYRKVSQIAGGCIQAHVGAIS